MSFKTELIVAVLILAIVQLIATNIDQNKTIEKLEQAVSQSQANLEQGE